MRSREEHLAFCKTRAREYLACMELENAVTSMLSDLQQHPETKLPEGSPLAMLGVLAAASSDPSEVRRFIEGFN